MAKEYYKKLDLNEYNNWFRYCFNQESYRVKRVDEVNGYGIPDEKYINKKLGKVSDDWRYYECNKEITYQYACEINGGRLEEQNNPYSICMSDKKPIFVDMTAACLSANGNLLLKSRKMSKHCEIGNGYLTAEIVNYLPLFIPLPIFAYVYVIWIFGEDGHLIEIAIEETIDAL